ncbi:MAG: diguanylate cyclase [Lachnospiraceae bacterium]|nr:diguanylate cyclase [Lachnospiraceae bacterium]
MSSYTFISIIALAFYVFFVATFLTARKNRIIRDFIWVLLVLVMWTGGSLLMRAKMWPSYTFWYQISLAGIWLLPYVYFCFIRDFAGEERKPSHMLWLILLFAGIGINWKTGFFLAPPVIVEEGGRTAFVYHMNWHVGIMYGLCAILVVRMGLMIWQVKKRKPERVAHLMPLLMGIVILYLGNLGVSVFKQFPVDILAGICNAVLLFYTLYVGQTFRLTLLGSRTNCYLVAMSISVLVFFSLAKELNRFIQEYMPELAEYDVMIVSVLVMLSALLFYNLIKRLFDRLFVKEEQRQTETLARYTMEISKSLNLKEIFSALVNVITDTLKVKKVYICIQENEGDYQAVYSSSPLDDKKFVMDQSHPLVSWMKRHDECLLLRDFKRTVEYKSMWEEEKKRLDDMKLECFLPLKDSEELVGIVMLGGKEKHSGFSIEDMGFLNSIESVSSIAVKNSRLYEKAYYEARTDELTGLLNRKCFYEVLEEAYRKCSRTSLSLLILNVDDFKLYNQLYGTREADEALRLIAQIIKGTVGENGYAARCSGKEFAVVLPGYDICSTQNLAENISLQIRNMNRNSKEGYLKTLTVSCGICGMPYAASTLQELLQNADRAVYHVKRSGKNGIMVYSDGILQMKKDGEGVEKHKSMYSEYAPTIYALTAAIDAKDHYTFQHSKNVAYYAENLAQAMNLSEEYRSILKEAALLHDIGKIGVSEHILNKEGKLTAEEYEAIKSHVEYSVGIIRHLPSMDYVIPAVIGHHERYDGKGYPRRIAGKDIPLAARLLCVADSFDAMTSKRCYRQAQNLDYAIGELERGAGTQFDPELVPVFVELFRSGKLTLVSGNNEERSEIL